MSRVTLIGLALWTVVGSASQSSAPPVQSESRATRVLATGLAGPWEITWGPDGFLWATERIGKRITRIDPKDGTKTVALTIPEVHQDVQQDGLLGLALHPNLLRGSGQDYAYVFFTHDVDGGPGVSRRGTLRRYSYRAGTQTLSDPVDLLTGLPVHNDHVSGRLAFGPDQMLYLSIGDQGSNFGGNACTLNRAQDLPSVADVMARDWTTYQGKLLRVSLDGSIPADNPRLAGVRSHIYSYGHRNIQGLAFGPDGTLYASEHGPSTDDELNLIQPGRNYGWPYVAGYRDDRGYVYGNWSAAPGCRTLAFSAVAVPPAVPQQKETAWNHPDFTAPLRSFFTVDATHDFRQQGNATIAPSSATYFGVPGIPAWSHSLLITSLRMGKVFRVALSTDGRSVAGDAVELFRTTNRYRDIAVSPDGRAIYVATDVEGRVLDGSGAPTRTLENPGAILEFTVGEPSGSSR